jgi:quinol monooxygenase YgiN
MLTLSVTYVILPGRERDAETCLRGLIEGSRAEPGCRTYDVFRAKDDPRTYLIFEQYDDEAALAAHRASPHFERYGAAGLRTMMESRVAGLYEPFE